LGDFAADLAFDTKDPAPDVEEPAPVAENNGGKVKGGKLPKGGTEKLKDTAKWKVSQLTLAETVWKECSLIIKLFASKDGMGTVKDVTLTKVGDKIKQTCGREKRDVLHQRRAHEPLESRGTFIKFEEISRSDRGCGES